MTSEPEIARRAADWPERIALVADGVRYTYEQLLHASEVRSGMLAAACGTSDARVTEVARVVCLLRPGFEYVAWQWAIWRAGAAAVPLSSSQAAGECDSIVADVEPLVVVGEEGNDALRAIAGRYGAAFIAVSSDSRIASEPAIDRAVTERARSDGALILYTSGTTSRPKGVVLTHANLDAQMSMLVEAWDWREDDRILHVLPLNHVHGIVNVLGCALWSGACCEFLSPFDARAAWDRLASGEVTVFMAVPTIYTKMLGVYDAATEADRRRWSAGVATMRVMVSGSAALPVTVLDRWREVTGHVLLERYGMTEIGMALSNPLHGIRRPGFVGAPLPGVEVRLVDERGADALEGTAGEIEVRGPGVFQGYWRRPEATREAFRDGWFRTGDVAVHEDGAYRILGRSSVDIIKTGGYKVSALEVEEVLRAHPGVAEVAVVGVPDEEWGERVAAAIVPRAGAQVSLDDLRAWASTRLGKYKLLTRLARVESLPRNAMGKIVKAEVRRLFTGCEF